MKFKITALSFLSMVILNLSPALSGEWTPVVTAVETDFYSIWGSSSTDVFAVGLDVPGPPRIYHYNGSTWSTMQPWSCSNECIYPAINKVWGNSESGVFALFETGDIIHYDGTNWISMYDADIYPELGMELNGIWGSSSSNVYVVGGTFIGVAFGGQRPVMPILIHYDGVNWLQGYIEGLPGETVKDIWGSSENDIFVVAAGYAYIKRSQILHYDGKSWTVMKRIPSTVLYDVWGSSGTDVFAVGHNDEGGVIWHYDGRKWIQMETGQNMEWFYPNAVWGSSGEDVYVGGMTGWGVTPFPIFHYDGRTWSAMANPPVNVEGIWGSSATDIYAAGWDYNWNGVILHYDGTDDGIAE